PIALDRAGFCVEEVDLWDLNEAFAVVGIVNNQKLCLNQEIVNVNGGAVSLGHPLGSSGCRIVVTLAHALKARGLKYGAAGICNGGGGASALIIEAL
ncbi:MAG: acetyl-CoA C-acetyltransferase, partial [Bacteroidetes bacterium]|nr:acetyl-CoA C-acetyltransferase [Bacteroidota bacterium]